MTHIARRTLLALGGSGLAASVLAACGGPSTSPSGDASAASAPRLSGVTPASEIEFWSSHPGGSRDIEKDIIEAFHRENPGITVKLVTAGKDYEEVATKFTTASAGGHAGDVVVASDATWFRFCLNRQIIPLDEVFASEKFEISDYRPALLADYLHEGRHYGVPYARSTPVFYYNKSHFSAAGLPDRAPQTWAELAQWAPALTRANRGAQQVFTVPNSDNYISWVLQNVVWGYGGGFSSAWDFSPTVSAETMTALSLIQKAIADSWAAIGSGDPADLFTSGATSTVIASTGALTGILSASSFPVGVGFLPRGSAKTSAVVPTGGAGVAINAGSSPERQLAAARFIRFLTDPANSARFSKATGYLPTRLSADMSSAMASVPQLGVAVKQLERARPQDEARVLLPGGDLELSKRLQAMLSSSADLKGPLNDLKSTLERLYTKDLKPRLNR